MWNVSKADIARMSYQPDIRKARSTSIEDLIRRFDQGPDSKGTPQYVRRFLSLEPNTGILDHGQ